CRSYAGSNVLF
nr:immunoglobulin light chain junction region [Macaca mulatta]MPO09098.1 immunoglobulin light chain junction region [Macaca mulatta]MPO10786.1 immunoglobulin light chain junction region [Macaca mulatta]MPO13996.1 immunoglobulin light chain junction region [Macaca mulatta]